MSRHKRQKKKTERIADLADRGVQNELLEVVDAVSDIVEESEDVLIEGMVETGKVIEGMSECLERIEDAVKKKSEEEYTYELSEEDKAELKGDKGDSYVLTEADKEEIASKIKPVEKIIEKTTIRTEVPIIKNFTKEIHVPAEIPNDIYESIDELQGNYKKIEAALKDGKPGKEIKLIGGPNGIFLYVNGVKKGIVKTLNIAGAGVSHSIVNGMHTITVAGGGGANIESEKVTGVQAGAEVTLDLTTLAEEFTKVLQVTRQGQVLTPGTHWSVAGSLLTIKEVVQADASEDFVIQYTY